MLENVEKEGAKMKYVAQLENGKAKVGIQLIKEGHDFYNLEGSDNIILFYTNRYKEQPLIVKGAGAGADVTASGIFADIMNWKAIIMDQVKIFAPASVATTCGFDVLGFCLEPVYDEMVIRKTESSGLKITKIVGQSLLLDVKKMLLAQPREAMLKAHPQKAGFEQKFTKTSPVVVLEAVLQVLQGLFLVSMNYWVNLLQLMN